MAIITLGHKLKLFALPVGDYLLRRNLSNFLLPVVRGQPSMALMVANLVVATTLYSSLPPVFAIVVESSMTQVCLVTIGVVRSIAVARLVPCSSTVAPPPRTTITNRTGAVSAVSQNNSMNLTMYMEAIVHKIIKETDRQAYT